MPSSPAVYIHRSATTHNLTEQVLGEVRVDVCRADDDDVAIGVSLPLTIVVPDADASDDPDDEGIELTSLHVDPTQGIAMALAIARASTTDLGWDLPTARVAAGTAALEGTDIERAQEILAAFGLGHLHVQ